MPNYKLTVGPFLTEDGVKILVLDEQGKPCSGSSRFELAQGESITVKTNTPETVAGWEMKELRIYADDDEHDAKGDLVHRVGRSGQQEIMAGNAVAEVTQSMAYLEHRGSQADSYRFAIDFVKNRGGQDYFVWDPDVHETKPGG